MSKIDSLIGQIGSELAAAASKTHVKDAKKSAPAVVSKKPPPMKKAAKKAPAKKAPAKKAAPKKAAPKKAAPKKEAKKPVPKRVVKKVIHKKATPAKKAAPVKKTAPAKNAASALWIKPVEGAFKKPIEFVSSGRKSEALNFAPGERRALLARVREALPTEKKGTINSIELTRITGSDSAHVRSVLRSLAVEGVVKLELLDGRRNGMTVTRL